MSQSAVNDYRSIVNGEVLVIDVRSPAEFNRGAVASAVNKPILNDCEREQVGICYHKKGREEAIRLGYQLVSGERRESRIRSWMQDCKEDPTAVLCCWRGGLRSQIAQQWLADKAQRVPVVDGGFKALRQYSRTVIGTGANRNMVVLGGHTGAGKTLLLQEISNAIDLEHLAKHRGSAFGNLADAQPPPKSFEFALAAELLRTESNRFVIVEDESRMIGKLNIPAGIFESMARSPLVVLTAPIEQRIQFTYTNYVLGQDYETLRNSLQRIAKRLGGLNYISVSERMAKAMNSGKAYDHYEWIRMLLQDYYDPMYDYQLSKKQDRIIFTGASKAVSEYLRSQYSD